MISEGDASKDAVDGGSLRRNSDEVLGSLLAELQGRLRTAAPVINTGSLYT